MQFRVWVSWQDRSGKLGNGAIANLVDKAGGALVHVEGLPMCVFSGHVFIFYVYC